MKADPILHPRAGKKRAIIFDLFGTLLQFNQRAFFRDLQAALQCSSGAIDRLQLRQLMVERCFSEEVMLKDLCRAMGVQSPQEEHVNACRTVLSAHLGRIEPYPNVLTLLRFLKRRGFSLGLLSNTSEAFATALSASGLLDFFNVASLSCDIRMAKPEPAAYLSICSAMKVEPEQCIFIGDSLENDFRAPLALGMDALCLRSKAGAESLHQLELSDLTWLVFDEGADSLKQLIGNGTRFLFNNQAFHVTGLTTLPDNVQGRYNIVGRVNAVGPTGQEQEFCIKRYLAPESVHVEWLAYQVMGLIAKQECHVDLLHSSEVLLLMTVMKGRHWASTDMDDSTARVVGFHSALAYLVGNADLRPRNTFISGENAMTSVSVIDLEHCFFDRALDLNDLSNPFEPATIDNLGCELETRTKHRVLSPAATRRARRSFLPIEDRSHPLVLEFKKGWIAAFDAAKARKSRIETVLMNRIYQVPYLIIGTQSYRRAMASVDVQDLMLRVQQDPCEAFDLHY